MTITPSRLSRSSLFLAIVSISIPAFGQARYSLHTSNQPLYQNSLRANYPYAAKHSSITSARGYRGIIGTNSETAGFNAAPAVTYTIIGRGVLRLADHRYMVQFFEDEPKDAYQIILNHRGGLRVEYKHDPDAFDWLDQLEKAVGSESTESVSKVKHVVPPPPAKMPSDE